MPLPEYPPTPGVVPKSAGVGLRIPERKADCSGVRPSWYPFQVNVCDVDAPDPDPLTYRQMHVPSKPAAK
jgi:hypothetical protein